MKIKEYVEKTITAITDSVSTVWFLLFCVVLTLIPLVFTKTLNVVQFISSAFLQLVLLPILAIGQKLQREHHENHAKKLDHIINHLHGSKSNTKRNTKRPRHINRA